MAAAGLIIGWQRIIVAYLTGIVAGAIVSVVLLALGRKKRGDEIPFGPFLSLGILIGLFFGDAMIAWYLGML